MNALSIDEAALDVSTTKRLPGYKHQRHAIDAGRATMGPESRNGFEFEVFKLDGRWHWRAFETVRPDTASELKANGKPRMAKPVDIKVHEERGRERAKAEGRLRKAKEAVPAPKAPVAAPNSENAPAWPPAPEMTIAGESIPRNTSIVGPLPGDTVTGSADGLDLPEFLKRPKPTPEETEAVRKKLAKTVGPERAIKNPEDAKKTTLKKDFPGTRALTRGGLIQAGIKAGHDDERILKDLVKAFPDCTYAAKDVKFYRRKLDVA